MVGKGHSSKNKENASTEGEADPDAFVFSTDGLIGDVQRKVMAVFEVFDQQGQKMVDVREVGTMCRALGKEDLITTRIFWICLVRTMHDDSLTYVLLTRNVVKGQFAITILMVFTSSTFTIP